MNKVLVKVEVTENNFSAYIEELPGCISTGKTLDDLKKNMYEAISDNLSVSLEFGDNIPSIFMGGYELVFEFDAK